MLLPVIAGVLCLWSGFAGAQDEIGPTLPPVQVLISVADQKLVVLRDGGLIAKYPVSTSRFGVGDAPRSYKTPVGLLRVYNKIGDGLSAGAVIKHRSATGEVIAVNAPGRDPIVTREIWLEGTQEQNANAKERAIYIHGTPEESMIGKPVSWGCIRMRSEDVIALYDQVGAGTEVDIMEDRLPHLHKYRPPPPPPPEPPVKEEPETAPIAKADVKASVKQVSQQPLPPAMVAEKPLAEKTTTPHPAVSHVAPVVAFHDADAEETPKNSYNPDAWRAMKGSVLMAGLPGAPLAATAKTSQQTTAQQTTAQAAK
jgi:hypothetical protein